MNGLSPENEVIAFFKQRFSKLAILKLQAQDRKAAYSKTPKASEKAVLLNSELLDSELARFNINDPRILAFIGKHYFNQQDKIKQPAFTKSSHRNIRDALGIPTYKVDETQLSPIYKELEFPANNAAGHGWITVKTPDGKVSGLHFKRAVQTLSGKSFILAYDSYSLDKKQSWIEYYY